VAAVTPSQKRVTNVTPTAAMARLGVAQRPLPLAPHAASEYE